MPRPILFIHGEKDDVAHLEIIREVYRKSHSPKRFVSFPHMDHIDLDRGEGFARQGRLSVRWFDRHLKKSGSGHVVAVIDIGDHERNRPGPNRPILPTRLRSRLISSLDEYKKNDNQEKVKVVYTQTFIGNNIKD